jgi:NAD(P)-dependent dehydrogenase (short-subunit alcohol dehydrogenase family)
MSKVILITGASSGIGFATLEQLVSEGHVVYGTARKKEDLDAIKKAGGEPLQVEMTDYKSIQAGVDKVIKNEKRIDVLFNNAGYGLYGAVEDVPIEAAKHQFDVNLFGLARITQLVTPHMRKQKSGMVINTSSMGGKMYTPFGAWYHATKHALEGWSDCLRFELKHFGIKVVIIEPGAITTPWGSVMHDNLMKYSGKGPYRRRAQKMADSTEGIYKNRGGSDPTVIAGVVSKAIASKRPKTRYAAGKSAKLAIFVRTKLGDRVFDKILDRLTR